MLHDLSRVNTQGALPRFNMPFELGVFVGAQAFGSDRHKRKKYLVLESELYQYQKFISDIAGQDVRCHSNLPEEAVKGVRQWLSDKVGKKRRIPGMERILLLCRQFSETLPGLLELAGQDIESMTFSEFRRYVEEFLDGQVKEKKIAGSRRKY